MQYALIQYEIVAWLIAPNEPRDHYVRISAQI